MKILERAVIPEDGGCWEVTPSRGNVYPKIYWKGKTQYLHRVMYQLINGEIPEGKVLLHSCDNYKCVNPAHLRPGTQSENMKDYSDKHRGDYCKLGHPYEFLEPGNPRNRTRICRICLRAQSRSWRARNKN